VKVTQSKEHQMFQISTSQSAERRRWRAGDRMDSPWSEGASHSLRLRVRVAARRDRLNRELADNADPHSSPELALRASQLTSDRRRKQLARTLSGFVEDANHPRLTRPPVVTINRAAVRDAEDAIITMITRLDDAEPVDPRGMAIAERIITDGADSPLYRYGQPGALRALVLTATAALDSSPAASHEWPLAA
jgi:hypothetical protein